MLLQRTAGGMQSVVLSLLCTVEWLTDTATIRMLRRPYSVLPFDTAEY